MPHDTHPHEFWRRRWRQQGARADMANGQTTRDIYAVAKPASAIATLATGVVVVAALYFAREIFVPLALAVLLSFALGPLVLLLRRWYFGRIPSVIAAVLLAFFVIFVIGSVIGSQLAFLAGNLAQYQS